VCVAVALVAVAEDELAECCHGYQTLAFCHTTAAWQINVSAVYRVCEEIKLHPVARAN